MGTLRRTQSEGHTCGGDVFQEGTIVRRSIIIILKCTF